MMTIVALGLGVLVAVGMITGVDLDFDRGRAKASIRDAQLVLGALALVLLAGVVGTARGFYADRSAAQVPLFVVALVVAVIWAFFRVVEYSS